MMLVTKYQILPSTVTEKSATKNVHICSMCIKINKVGKQEVGIWWVQKRFPRYGVPIWSLWPNMRFLPSIVAEKNVTKNVLYLESCLKRTLSNPVSLCKFNIYQYLILTCVILIPVYYKQNIYYTPAPRRGSGVYCFTCLSVRSSKIFFVAAGFQGKEGSL
jgi:hypothetical protein